MNKDMSYFPSATHNAPDIDTFWVPRWVLERTWALIRQDGRKNVESTVLWGGRRFDRDAVVMSALYPCGHDVSFTRGLIHVGADTTAEMGRWLREQGLRGLIQVHSHPSTWTGHSRTDDEYPIISAEGFVSLVWPNFGALPARSIHDFGVHRLLGGRWYDVAGIAAEKLIRIVESEAMIWAPNPIAGALDGKEPSEGVI